jgi:hypothetical protein
LRRQEREFLELLCERGFLLESLSLPGEDGRVKPGRHSAPDTPVYQQKLYMLADASRGMVGLQRRAAKT